MVEHIALFRWTEEASQEAIDNAEAKQKGNGNETELERDSSLCASPRFVQAVKQNTATRSSSRGTIMTISALRIVSLPSAEGTVIHHVDDPATIRPDGSRQPTENELAIARFQGRHVAQIAQKLFA